MPEILSQEEIDALLKNIETKEVQVEKENIDKGPAQADIEKKASLYDFRRPDKVSKEQIRAIKNLHDKFANNFSSRLSTFLRTITEVKVMSVDQMTYGEFALSLSDNVSFNVINLAPLEGNAVLSIEPDVGFMFIDRLLGGIGEKTEIARPFTDIEQNILKDIVKQALDVFKIAWKPILDMQFEIISQENSPNIIQIVAPSEIVILVVFEITIGEKSGIINWCLPVIVLEPILNKIGSHDILMRGKKNTEDRSEDIMNILKNVSVNLCFQVGQSNIKVRDFLNLSTGNVVVLNKKITDTIEGYVNNVGKFHCKMGKIGNKKAMSIKSFVNK